MIKIINKSILTIILLLGIGIFFSPLAYSAAPSVTVSNISTKVVDPFKGLPGGKVPGEGYLVVSFTVKCNTAAKGFVFQFDFSGGMPYTSSGQKRCSRQKTIRVKYKSFISDVRNSRHVFYIAAHGKTIYQNGVPFARYSKVKKVVFYCEGCGH